MLEINKIYNMDCLIGLKQLEDNCVDCIITDPPYNIGQSNKLSKSQNKIISNKDNWGHFEPTNTEEYLSFLQNVFYECYRVCKGSIIVFYNRLEITKIKDMLNLVGFYPNNLLCIVKRNSLPHFRKNGFRSDFELAIYCQKVKGKDTFNFLNQALMKGIDYYAIGQNESRHPTEKPKEIIKKYIRIISNKDDVILDPFIGSGTTAVACKELQRNFIGFEISKEYCDIANERCSFKE